jgi:hypothetical protein
MHDVWYINVLKHRSRAVVVNPVQCDGRKTAKVTGCVALLDALSLTHASDARPEVFRPFEFYCSGVVPVWEFASFLQEGTDDDVIQRFLFHL